MPQLKESTVTNQTTGATETVTVAGDVVAVLNVTANATSVSGQVSDAGGGKFVHTMEIKFEEVILMYKSSSFLNMIMINYIS